MNELRGILIALVLVFAISAVVLGIAKFRAASPQVSEKPRCPFHKSHPAQKSSLSEGDAR
jgi:hypothetical protein